MEGFETLVKSLSESPSAALLGIALLALGYMYRESREREKAHLETVMQIAPLASKLTDAIAALERMSMELMKRGRDD